MTIDEQRIWRTVCAALVLLMVCGGVACGAEGATIPAGDEASGLTWTQVWGIIAGITAVGGVASVGGVAIGKRMRVSVEPQPLEIKSHPDYATKQDLRRLEERQSSFEKDMRDLMRDAEGKTHTRLDKTNERLAEIAGGQKLLIENVNALLGRFVDSAIFSSQPKQ